MNPTRLFVGNISYQSWENDLRDYFAQAGAGTSVNLMLDTTTGKSRGFRFVELADTGEAQRAIDHFHNQEFQRRQVNINVARPREDRLPGWATTGAIHAATGVNGHVFRMSRLARRRGWVIRFVDYGFDTDWKLFILGKETQDYG